MAPETAREVGSTICFTMHGIGVSGGIACYKACVVARRLTEAGVEVEAVLTAAAEIPTHSPAG